MWLRGLKWMLNHVLRTSVMYEIPSSLAEFLFHGQISTEKTMVKKSGVELEKQICEYTIL